MRKVRSSWIPSDLTVDLIRLNSAFVIMLTTDKDARFTVGSFVVLVCVDGFDGDDVDDGPVVVVGVLVDDDGDGAVGVLGDNDDVMDSR